MSKALVLIAILLGFALWTCTNEDGQPDPPLQVLVPCDPTAPVGSPLACPDLGMPASDALPEQAQDGGTDAARDGD